VTIRSLELLDISKKSWIFRVVCSPGTYVRSIARDLAEKCGTLATVDRIRRIRTNGLDIKDTARLDFLENLFNNNGSFKKYLKPVDFGLGDIPVLNLDEKSADLYKKGGFVEERQQCESGRVRVFMDDRFLGIGCVEKGLVRPKRTLL
jgi:tRNA pseudouridine55 synthase